MGYPVPTRDIERDEEIARLYKVNRLTVFEIGAVYNLSHQRVSDIIKRMGAGKPRKTRSDKKSSDLS